jgi:hypothetical protein
VFAHPLLKALDRPHAVAPPQTKAHPRHRNSMSDFTGKIREGVESLRNKARVVMPCPDPEMMHVPILR